MTNYLVPFKLKSISWPMYVRLISDRVSLNMLISEAELKRSDVLPSYKLGSFTTMMSHSWKQIPVSVRRGERGVLVRELRTMSGELTFTRTALTYAS